MVPVLGRPQAVHQASGQPGDLGDRADRLADVGHVGAAGGRQCRRRRQHHGVGVLPTRAVHVTECGRQDVHQILGAGEEVTDGHVLDRDGGVLQAQQVLGGRLERVEDQPARGLRRVEGRDHQPVAEVEVRLPVDGVVLVAPRHVPDRCAGQRDRGEPGRTGTEAVLGVVPLDEQRQRLTDGLRDDARDEAHPPAVVVDVDAAVQQRRLAQRLLREVVVVLDVVGSAPHEDGPVDALAHDVQVAACLQVEHLPADECRHGGEASEGECTQDRVGLDLDVVVHEEDVLGVGGGQRLVHDAAVPTGPAEIGLVVDAESVTEVRGDVGEVGPVAHLARALVRHDHRVDDVHHQRVGRDRGEGGDAVGGTVERRDSDRDAAGPRRGDGRVPPGGVDAHVVVGGDVEPDPSAVLERPQVDLELEGVRAVGGGAVDVDAGAVGLRAVDVDPAFAGQFHPQHDGGEHAPPTPVARGERVEVGAEGHLGLGADGHRGPRERVCPTGIGGGLVGVERAHVERFAGPRQQDPVQQCAIGHDAPSPGAPSGAPDSRCGRSVFSKVVSALAIAMCMSRYW